MSFLAPFRARRPEPAAASSVAAVPYDVVNTDEARALAAGNPLSFLRVSRAEIDLPSGTDPHADLVYERAAANYKQLASAAPLVLEASPALYVYRLRMGPHVQTGVAGLFSLDEYDDGRIKRHEFTRRDKEDDRTRHIDALGSQTGPVFLTYAAAAAVDAGVSKVTAGAPLFDFAAADGVRHTVWRAGDESSAALVQAFAAIPALYIADGHHRAASAARVRALRAASANCAAGPWDRFLAVAFPDVDMQILAYNRLVKDLRGLTPAAFLEQLSAVGAVRPGPATPERPGDVSLFVGDGWQTLTLAEAPADAVAADRLDVSRLQDQVLAPLLGIGDPRTDTRIDFVGGGRGTGELESAVRTGRAAAAFSMHPVSIRDLMTIADAGGIMPPKSTWFEPKLRDGLLCHEF